LISFKIVPATLPLSKVSLCIARYAYCQPVTTVDNRCLLVGEVTTDFIADFEDELVPVAPVASSRDWALGAALRYLLVLTKELTASMGDTRKSHACW
jgi:hypothetical protein